MAGRIGTQIAGYRIESLLSRGGMGEVYLAEQDSPRRKVALKLLAPELSEEPGFRERFVRESDAAASIDHPNVIPIYASGQSAGALFIAMRYVEGTDLRALLASEGPLPPERAVHICAQIADALEAAHERGLVHRDVKPANILVAKGDHAYLSDFGLIRRSEVSTGITKTGQFMGTIDYAAPEQIKGEAVDGRADIYSLGCVLYECLTGEPPFRRATEVATLYAHLEDPPPIPSARGSGISAELDGTVSKAMAKTPQERFGIAGELGAALRTTAGLEEIGLEQRPFPERRRRRRLGAALLVGLAVILGLVLWQVGGVPFDTATPPPTPANAARIDPDSNEVVQAASGGSSGSSAVAAEGGLWVTTQEGVVKRDELTGTVEQTLETSEGVYLLASGYGAIWVTTASIAPELVRINPATGDTKSVDISAGARTPFIGGGVMPVATGSHAVWVVNSEGILWKIDPITMRIVFAKDVALVGSSIATAAGSVWVADTLSDSIVRVDPASGLILETIDFAGTPDWLAFAGGRIWVEDYGSGTITPIAPGTNELGSPIAVGRNPSWMSAGLGDLWVPAVRSVTRVDPTTGRTEDISIDFLASSVAIDARNGIVWAIQGWGRGSTARTEPK